MDDFTNSVDYVNLPSFLLYHLGRDAKDIFSNLYIAPLWVFFGRTDTEAETPILCPPDVKN